LELFVVKQQIDELCDLKVIGRDLWLSKGSNDEVVLLLALVQLHVPSGNAVDAASSQDRIY
jgi:hypothetical protein